MTESISLRFFQAKSQWLDADWNGQNRRNSFWRLYFNDIDGACVWSEGVPYEVAARHLFLLPAGVRFDFAVEAQNGAFPWHFHVHFDVPGFAGFRLREVFDVPVLLSHRPQLEARTTELRDWIAANGDLEFSVSLLLHALVLETIGLAWQEMPTEKQARGAHFTAQHEAMTPALRYMETHLKEPLRNEDLAELCHLSRDHFIRRFKAATRLSPQSYLLERRVALAAQKLLFTEDSIEKIATDCGFANRFYFSRVFAKVMGISPATFRRDGVRR